MWSLPQQTSCGSFCCTLIWMSGHISETNGLRQFIIVLWRYGSKLYLLNRFIWWTDGQNLPPLIIPLYIVLIINGQLRWAYPYLLHLSTITIIERMSTWAVVQLISRLPARIWTSRHRARSQAYSSVDSVTRCLACSRFAGRGQVQSLPYWSHGKITWVMKWSFRSRFWPWFRTEKQTLGQTFLGSDEHYCWRWAEPYTRYIARHKYVEGLKCTWSQERSDTYLQRGLPDMNTHYR